MLRLKILATVGFAVGIVGAGWGFAQQRNAPGFYELRIYKAQPGKRDALAARFAARTAAIYARHGITNVGYFIPEQSDRTSASTQTTPLSMFVVTRQKRSAIRG
jgi:NIPSNAP